MTTRKQIILAVSNGCVNTRKIAKYLDGPLSTINGYFYNMNNDVLRFVNGDLLQWTPTKTNTLRLFPLAAIVRGPDGQIKDVRLVADMNDLEASFNQKDKNKKGDAVEMKVCKKCDGEGENAEGACQVCDGMGVVGVPTSIYLQLVDLDEITWCEDRIYDNDIEYVIVPSSGAAIDVAEAQET